MLKNLARTTIFALLLLVLSGQFVYAQTKIYQYDGKLPFVQMMLNMMTAMGILERLPNNLAYGYNGLSGASLSPWARYNNPVNNTAAIWGSPDWGVLPVESYAHNYYSPYGSRRSTDDLSGWVNESWETSQWNSKAKSQRPSENRGQTTAPIVQNFSYNVIDPPEEKNARKNNQSPLAKISPSNSSLKKQGLQRNRRSVLSKTFSKQKPCITDYCGLKKPSLNGLWVAQNGEMLGVKNHRYLWSDSKSRYLTGLIKVQNEYLLANVDGYNQLMRFKYKLAGNRLLAVQPDGQVHDFVRMPVNQYNSLYRGYGQNYGNYYQ